MENQGYKGSTKNPKPKVNTELDRLTDSPEDKKKIAKATLEGVFAVVVLLAIGFGFWLYLLR